MKDYNPPKVNYKHKIHLKDNIFLYPISDQQYDKLETFSHDEEGQKVNKNFIVDLYDGVGTIALYFKLIDIFKLDQKIVLQYLPHQYITPPTTINNVWEKRLQIYDFMLEKKHLQTSHIDTHRFNSIYSLNSACYRLRQEYRESYKNFAIVYVRSSNS